MSEPCHNCERWCQRHSLIKGPNEVALCQRDSTTREYLDNTADDRREELVGTKLSKLFKAAGVTPERYGAFKQWMGIPSECECQERENWINSLHALAKEVMLKSNT